MNLKDKSLSDIVCEVPNAIIILRAHNLDFCHEGQLSLSLASRMAGADIEVINNALETQARTQPPLRDWRNVDSGELIDHILEHFHEKHRMDIPHLISMAERVERSHAEHPLCPHGLADLLLATGEDLHFHMLKEEEVLFPLLRQNRRAMAEGPIRVMQMEHVQHGEALQTILMQSHDLQAPPEACGTWRTLYKGLEALRDDLLEHIHLENNILFRETH
ncbi:iron-sulfur cluster repair di-iron protein [Asticcacaulis tiandongensis]|uniref:iron-sulfur cluster repair di-iron protein n=1 Tax=Asticcacaulis tiandongensis TaxID=2565365 RepID=UPI00112B89C2|nr:iron-sulfur cluster repair di-iron protein [Asticcacaulis tiandongensis]